MILQDYVLEPDGRAGEYTVHVVVLRNDNTETCSIRTHSCAIGPDDAVAEENRMEIPALGPGQVTAFMERFWPENNIDHVDTEFEISEAYGRDAQSVLRLDDTPIDHGVDVTLTNTGDYPVSSLSLCVLFFDEAGNCVDAQDTGMDLNSDGKPVRPGDTAVPMFGKELVTPAVFSSYEIYYHGIEWFD